MNLDALKKNLTELKNLNPKTPGAWPWLAKIMAFVAMFAVVVAAGAWFIWEPQLEELSKIKQEEITLKDTFLFKKKQAINLDLIKKQLTETQESFGALLKQLPSKSEMDALLTDINQAGLGRGLQFELFKPGDPVSRGAFIEQPITIKVSGNYDDIGKFASDIGLLPRIVTLNDISIIVSGSTQATTAGAQPAVVLVMDATAKTFRYLDPDEAAAQKKKDTPAAAPATAPTKPGGHGGGG
ncbi:MAG: type 4a pilus biogenesis protein PilO [Nitrosomonadales bacterium]|nr:type 4a pilus biogenesis protein PilO [Nitrosomonadales bacterium]